MEKIEMTDEVKKILDGVTREWLDRLFDRESRRRFDLDAAKEGMTYFYQKAGFWEPEYLVADSPWAAQMLAAERTGERKYRSTAYYPGLFYWGWTAYYEAAQRLGIYDSEAIQKLLLMQKSGVYDCIQFDMLCIFSRHPEEIFRDKDGDLHSTERAAISWSDGFELYFLEGVRFPRELWQKVVTKSASAVDIMMLENTEQRRVALFYNGMESFVQEQGKPISYGSRNNAVLYLLEGVLDEPMYWVSYDCPTTGRKYVSPVDPEVGVLANADLWMATKGGLDLQSYLKGCYHDS